MVAQLVEQRSPKPQVAGSSPVRPAFIASINNLYARTPGVLFRLRKGQKKWHRLLPPKRLLSPAHRRRAIRSSVSSSIFAFLREVIAELKKVTTPTGRELVGYFFGVLFFVVVMLLLISGLDYLFYQGAFWIFGNGTIQRN